MKLPAFLTALHRAARAGYAFYLGEGIRLGPDGERIPRKMLRCSEIPGEQPRRRGLLPVEAVCHFEGLGLPETTVPSVEAGERLQLSDHDAAMILRAGEQIVCYDKEGNLRVKHSRRLRKDMLAACQLEG